MKRLIPQGRSLQFYGLLAWVIPGAMAILACVFVLAGTSYVEYRNDVQRTISQLTDDSRIVARRIAAELLIGERGAPEAVAQALVSELALAAVTVKKQVPECLKNSDADFCALNAGSSISVFRRIPAVPEVTFVEVSRQAPSLFSHLRITTLLWSTVPIALMLFLGLLFQRYVIRRYLLSPIRSLVDTSTGLKDPRPYWPSEIKEISDRLYFSFEKRDEAIFSQVARGVIHDLRTLIQSPLTALELLQESVNAPDKHARRLLNLADVASEQLPKMREIIDTTLDGSREITVSPKMVPIEETILGAQHSLQPLIEQTGVELRIVTPSEETLVAHDPIQLERAITNIMKNGIEACSEVDGGSNELWVDLKCDEVGVVIRIEDSGPGLRTQSSKLFRPLKSTKPHGSGLGLVVSRKIIAAHGGTVTPGSSENLGGAAFEIRLPGRERAT